MLKLPTKTILGKLIFGEVLEFFDFPRLFTCKNTTNQQYLVLSTLDDEAEYHWLYLPITSLRLNAVLSGAMPLYQAFRSPEGDFLYKVVTSERGAEITHVLPEQIDDDDLPLPDYVLTNGHASLDDEEIVIDAEQVAVATRRETFNYHLYPSDSRRHEVSARRLGEILSTTQELLDALGQACDGEPTVRGALPAELLQKTRVNVCHVFRGSFGVQFRSAQYSDLLSQSKISDALAEFGNLLLAADSEDNLSNKLHSLKGRVASKYRRLLEELSSLGSGLQLDWGAVQVERGGRFVLTHEQVRKAFAIVDKIDIEMAEELVVRGKLVGFNSRTKRYEIRSEEDDKSYAGKVAVDAQIIEHPAIGDSYFVRLRMQVETQSSTGDELVRWVLMGLSQSNPSK